MSSLVAYYGSSDEEDGNDMEMDTDDSSMSTLVAGVPLAPASDAVVSKAKSSQLLVRIQDEVDDSEESLMNLGSDDVPETSKSSSALKLDKILPKPKGPARLEIKNEDIIEEGPVPPKKIYGDEEQPKPSTFHNISTKKSAKGIIQISIPSLKNFGDEEEDSEKRAIFHGSQKVSGLFALLPQPKHELMVRVASNSSEANPAKPTSIPLESHSALTATTKKSTPLIPHAVQQGLAGKRLAPPNERLAQIRSKYMKQEANFRIVSRSASSTKSENPDKDDSDEEVQPVDFFSLDSSANDNFDVSNTVSSDIQNSAEINLNPDVEEYVDPSLVVAIEEPLPPVIFENKVEEQPDLMKYIQPTKKGRGKVAPINIIDVSADDLRPATTDWLKTITDTSMIPPRKAVLPGGMTKRKHQITYLAAEAKAREEELQNQWAQNRQARRQTQNKYGF